MINGSIRYSLFNTRFYEPYPTLPFTSKFLLTPKHSILCTNNSNTHSTIVRMLIGCVDNDDDALLDSTPFHSATRTAAAFTQRHVEESWLHLLLAGDFSKLKDLTVCNFDFLLASVRYLYTLLTYCILMFYPPVV